MNICRFPRRGVRRGRLPCRRAEVEKGKIALNCIRNELIQIVRTAQNAPHGTELRFQATNWRRYSIGVSFVLS